MDNIRKGWHVCVAAFRKIIRTPRFGVAFLWFVFLVEFVILAIRRFCILTGIGVSPWLFPLLTKESGNQFFLIIGAMILFCDAPFLCEGSGWQILRAGRRNWFWGNVLYIWLLSLIYAAGLAFIPVFLMLPHVEWTAGWGRIIGTLAQTEAAAQIGITSLSYDIVARYEPWQAMVLTVLPVWLNTVLIGMVNYALNFWIGRGAGAGVSAAIGLSPMLISYLARNHIGYYLSPPLWMSLAYYKRGNYGIGPSFAYAYGVMLAVTAACTAVSYIGIQKRDLNTMEDS